MEKIELSISTVMGDAWELVKKHGLMLTVTVLLIGVVEYALSFTYYGDANTLSAVAATGDTEKLAKAMGSLYAGIFTNPMFFVSLLIIQALGIGLYKMILNIASGETDKVDFNAYKMEPMTYVKVIAVNIIYALVTYIGFICCVIPGIFIGVRLAFAALYQLDNPKAGIGEAFSASWNMTNGNFLSAFGLAIIAGLIALSGLLLCCVGVCYTVTIMYSAYVIAYLTLKQNL